MLPKILLVEDDQTMLALLRTLLRYEGFEVADLEHDDSIADILEEIRLKEPVVVLLDVHLRKVNGLDLLTAMRAGEQDRHTGVIMSSGLDVSDRCLKAGADAFILKPYMPDDLITRIRQVITATAKET
jgi:two-component system phosphate regulon response regulator PhoB